MLTIFVFGNPDLPNDSLPLRLLPALQARFSDINFVTKDPNEEWEIEGKEIFILDTVAGLKEVRVFNSLKEFSPPPRVSLHDFDAYLNLWHLEKLGKVKKVTIIGVPPIMPEAQAMKEIIQFLEVKPPKEV